MNPLTECYCSYCNSLITGRQYCMLGFTPLEWLILVYLIINVCYIMFVLEFHDWGSPPWWFQILLFPAYIFFHIRVWLCEGF